MHQRLAITAIALYCFFTVPPAQATFILEMPFEEVVTASAIIFEGQVISKETRTLKNGQPMTFFTFRIHELLKGEHKGETIELGFLGGMAGGERTQIQGLQMPGESERGIYFVENPNKLFVNPLYGWHQGHYIIDKGSSGEDRIRMVGMGSGGHQVPMQHSHGTATETVVPHSHAPVEHPSQSLSAFKQKLRNMLGK